MTDNAQYIDPALARELYGQIDKMIDSRGSVRDVYSAIRQIFNRVTDLATRQFEMAFSGILPRVDFLLKRFDSKHLTQRDTTRIHSLRYRLSRLDDNDDESFYPDGSHLDDIASLARWIEILSGVRVPDHISSRLPGRAVSPEIKRVRSRSLRFILDSIDGDRFIGRLDDGEMTPAVVNLKGPDAASDFTYLLEHAAQGNQYNIVNPATESDSSLTPALIIYEPDYLVDISSVAECFTPYGVNALAGLINKLAPEKNTRPILLGQFAGQLLDMVVNAPAGGKLDYGEAVRNFFASAALRIATCNEIDSTFHTDARAQLANIESAISNGLKAANSFDRSLMLLEPSFFCEMLGLQGRMDMLQTDFAILVEQKSGKGAWGSDPHGAPRPATPHFVQLLLYQAVLHYGFDVKGKNLSSFLLYSKYPVPLVRTSSAPQLLADALKVRNEIARIERECASGDTFEIVKTLTPDDLNTGACQGVLWEKYIEPQLSAILNPARMADPLSMRYVERMLRFVAMEHSYAKTGFNGETFSAGFSGAWTIPSGEKKLAGDLCDNLTLVPEIEEGKPVSAVKLIYGGDTAGMSASNFRRGDIVVLYSYHEGRQPDIRRSIVIRGSIKSIDADAITLSLRAPQSNLNIFKGNRLWAIEHDFLDSSLRQLYRGVYSLLSAPASRRELILGQRKPQSDDTVTMIGEYGTFNPLVQRALQARDMFLIIGPPGTGKTSHGLLNILKEHLLHDAAVIAGAYTNRAVDEICSQLDAAGIDYIRIGSSLGCSPEYQGHLLEIRLNECGSVSDVRSLLSSATVFVGTIQALSSASSTLFSFRRFDLAIIDEASQILEPHLVGLMSAVTPKGDSAISKFVFIGDHCQLPAVVLQPVERSLVTDPHLNKIGLTDCRSSFFERMLGLLRNDDGSFPIESVYFLERQGRMHSLISDLASDFFYHSKLDVVPLPHQTGDIPQVEISSSYGRALNHSRLLFVDVDTASDEDRSGSNACYAEAHVIADFAAAIYHRTGDNFDPATTLGIIVPYRSQIAAIRQCLAATGIEALADVTVDTVERFQGSQRDYIIYGFTLRHLHQMSFLTSSRFIENGHTVDRKLNVAITRARSHLIVVGNRQLLETDPLFRDFIARLDRV